MTLATNTTQGEIQLAGDLAGDGSVQTGSNPQLTHIVGLTPGSYNAAKITVDSKGRVILASTPSAAEISDLLPGASTDTIGAVMLGDNIYKTTVPSAGYQVVNFGGAVVGGNNTGLANQSCATYSVTINIDNSGNQIVSAAGSSLQTFNDVITAINTQTTGCTAAIVGGNIRITSDTTGRLSTVSITNDKMFGCMTGYGSISTAVNGEDTCEIYVPAATDTVKGVVKIGAAITVDDGVISFDPNNYVASATSLGLISVPSANGLSVDGAGAISVALATGSTKGVMQVGAGLDVTAGVVSVPDATTGSKGIMQVGTGLSVTSGVVSLDPNSLPLATESTKGVMQVGAGLDVDVNGVVSVDFSEIYTDATTGSKGLVQIGTNINVSSGVISVPDANSTTTKGVVRSANASNISIAAGVLDVGTNIPKKNSSNTYTKQNVISPVALTSGTTVNVDATASNVFTLTLSHNATLANPTGLVAGQCLTFIIKRIS